MVAGPKRVKISLTVLSTVRCAGLSCAHCDSFVLTSVSSAQWMGVLLLTALCLLTVISSVNCVPPLLLVRFCARYALLCSLCSLLLSALSLKSTLLAKWLSVLSGYVGLERHLDKWLVLAVCVRLELYADSQRCVLRDPNVERLTFFF